VTTPPPVNRFFVRQKITLMVNRYEVLAANLDGTEGAGDLLLRRVPDPAVALDALQSR
jgi:hypothetical protein